MAQLILNHLTKDFGGKGADRVRPAVSDVSLALRKQGFSHCSGLPAAARRRCSG